LEGIAAVEEALGASKRIKGAYADLGAETRNCIQGVVLGLTEFLHALNFRYVLCTQRRWRACGFKADALTTHSFPTLDGNTHFNGLPPSLISKFPASSLFCAARNKSDFRQIAEASPNPPWILYLTLYVTTRLCLLFVTRCRVYSADYDPR
jgi:hypothetical protein